MVSMISGGRSGLRRGSWWTCAAWVMLLIGMVANVGVAIAASNPAPLVIPSLQHWHGGDGYWRWHPASIVWVDPAGGQPLHVLGRRLADEIGQLTGQPLRVRSGTGSRPGDIVLRLVAANATGSGAFGDEGYALDLGDSIQIRAHTLAGAFYATRTILQMLVVQGRASGRAATLPKGAVVDTPRYRERSVMFDVGRKFADKRFLEAYLRFMGWYKLNTLHLHLNDQVKNQAGDAWQIRAFRLKSDRPEFRGLIPADGLYYTRQDWDELEAVAAANAVTIVPEIDTPGHAGALVAAQPQWGYAGDSPPGGTLDPTRPQTLSYVEAVFAEFLPWFHSPLIHIGGDEVNVNKGGISVASQISYINQLGRYLQRQGKQVEVWGDASFAAGLDKSFRIQRWINWGSESSIDWGKLGFEWTESYGDWYIVPFGPAYFHPDGLRGDQLYAGWASHLPVAADTAARLSGGQISVWNDQGQRDYSYADTIHDLLKDAIPAAGQLFWSGTAYDSMGRPLDYPSLRPSIKKLQYGPGHSLFPGDPL